MAEKKTKKNVKVAVPAKYCPGHENAMEDLKYMSNSGLYRSVMGQPPEFYMLTANDFKLLMEPDETQVAAFLTDTEVELLNDIKARYSTLTRQQLVKILIIKKYKDRG